MICLACLGDGMEMRFDKKQRPYFYCSLCQTRIFFRTEWPRYTYPMIDSAFRAWGPEKILARVQAMAQRDIEELLPALDIDHIQEPIPEEIHEEEKS